jgi:membrane protease YdiL (CAAX protease family)
LNDIADIIIAQDIPAEKTCINCNEPVITKSRFCKHCGFAQEDNDAETVDEKWSSIKQLALFYIFDVVICCLHNFTTYFKTLSWSVTFHALLAIVAVTFFCDNWSQNKTLLIWRNFSLRKLSAYLAIIIASSVVINYAVDWLNQSLFSEQFSLYAFYSTYAYGKLLMIFFVAVMPALFEELAYRGYVLQKLLNLADKNQAIFISAFLFAILHFSFISLVWLIPFALLLGYVRVKENTLWYGIAMHFTFNFTACMLELYHLNH